MKDDPDGRVSKELAAAGSDLSKPHTVKFFSTFRMKRAGPRHAAS